MENRAKIDTNTEPTKVSQRTLQHIATTNPNTWWTTQRSNTSIKSDGQHQRHKTQHELAARDKKPRIIHLPVATLLLCHTNTKPAGFWWPSVIIIIHMRLSSMIIHATDNYRITKESCLFYMFFINWIRTSSSAQRRLGELAGSTRFICLCCIFALHTTINYHEFLFSPGAENVKPKKVRCGFVFENRMSNTSQWATNGSL
jgi:hypothetical protein